MLTAGQRPKPLGLFQGEATPRLRADGYDIRTMQELPGHKDVRTAMIHTHVLNRGGRGVRSPANDLDRHHDERQAETAWRAEERTKNKQAIAAIRLATIGCQRVRLQTCSLQVIH